MLTDDEIDALCDYQRFPSVRDAVREAVRLTAERCAEICLDRFPYWPSPQPAAVCPFCEQEIEAPEVDWHYACTECAAAIRERAKAPAL